MRPRVRWALWVFGTPARVTAVTRENDLQHLYANSFKGNFLVQEELPNIAIYFEAEKPRPLQPYSNPTLFTSPIEDAKNIEP